MRDTHALARTAALAAQVALVASGVWQQNMCCRIGGAPLSVLIQQTDIQIGDGFAVFRGLLVPDHCLVKILLYTASQGVMLAHVHLRCRHSVSRGLVVPANGFFIILRGAKPVGIEVAQIDLGCRVSLLCREAIPFSASP